MTENTAANRVISLCAGVIDLLASPSTDAEALWAAVGDDLQAASELAEEQHSRLTTQEGGES